MGETTESVRVTKTKRVENVYCRVYLSGAQTNLTDTDWVKITLNAIDKDLGLNFDTVTSKFTVPVTGLYDVIGAVEFSSVITDKRYMVAIYKNGTSVREVSGHASFTGNLTVECNDKIYLAEGDEIELYAQAEAGASTVDVVSGNKATILILHLVTKEGTRQ